VPHAIRVDDRWYIPATSSRADDRTRVLKSADGFAVFSRHGEMSRVGLGEQGLYHLGTRHLSEWRLLVEGHEPMLLNSTVRRDNSRLAVDQTTPDLNSGGRTRIPKGTVHLKRELAAHDCALTERLTVVNYHDSALSIGLEYHFAADFRDIFEVRGQARERRGEIHAPEVSADGVILTYAGLDAVIRRTRIAFDPAPASLGPEAARFAVDLLPGATWTLEISVACASGGAHFCIADHGRALAAVESEVAFDRASRVEIFTDNEQFNDWINRSAADLQLLITETRHGLYPYAGVPWFSTPFGHSGLITTLQTLWSQPSIATDARPSHPLRTVRYRIMPKRRCVASSRRCRCPPGSRDWRLPDAHPCRALLRSGPCHSPVRSDELQLGIVEPTGSATSEPVHRPLFRCPPSGFGLPYSQCSWCV